MVVRRADAGRRADPCSTRQASLQGVDARAKRLTLIACILGSAVVFVDGTIVNVALPTIRADLDVGLADQQWIMDAYLLTLGSFLLVGGSLGDLYGRRRMFRLGVIGFGVTSLVCAVAPDATLAEHCDRWVGDHGVRVSGATMQRAIARLGWTRKKRRSTPANRTR